MEQTPQGDASTPTPTSPLSIKTPAVPESLTTVTPLSKALATALFILLPFMGFLFGVQYAQSIASQQTQVPLIPLTPADTLTPPVNTIDSLPSEGGSSPAQPGPNDTMPTADVGVPGVPSRDTDVTPVPPPSATSECGVTNCHGMDITCGNVSQPLACTEMYQAGDNCRQFASCEIVDGACTPVLSERFKTCKTCVETCETKHAGNPADVFACESTCAQ
jgi:hypothetical protein